MNAMAGTFPRKGPQSATRDGHAGGSSVHGIGSDDMSGRLAASGALGRKSCSLTFMKLIWRCLWRSFLMPQPIPQTRIRGR